MPASLKVATGGSAQPKKRKRKRRKGSLRRMVPPAQRGRVRVGGGRTVHEREAGLLQLRSLTSYLLLQSSNARPSRTHHVHRSGLPQQTLYRVPWRLPMLHLPPRVADMVDEAEEEAGVGGVPPPTDS